ncbi:MAG: hypothetical protein R3250_18525, partial [Melioribacteraceae bacterium]|nr:hypothetical protein [Melioribacteraceae bacterium]
VIMSSILALVYSYSTTPIYEAKVVLKKEVAPGNRQTNEFYEIVKLQTQDEVETEMELVKTGEVLGKVVDELNLVVSYDRIVGPDEKSFELKKSIVDYLNPEFHNNFSTLQLPQFVSVKLKDENKAGMFVIERVSEKEFSIRDAVNDKQLKTFVQDSVYSSEKGSGIDSSIISFKNIEQINIVFDIDLARIELNWQNPPIGTKFFFKVNSYYESVINLGQKVSIGRKGKTNVFTVSVKSQSAYSSMVLANLLIDKFRESRIEQQKQTIRYSFNFVDEQLEKMQGKLREAEDNLSNFKSSGQITTIDASSQEVIKFLSTLEAEKMNTELELTGYRNKLDDMKNELQASGYFDQSFLSPSGSTDGNDPFSALLRQLSELELRKLELLQKRTESHPDVINLEEQIKMVKDRLASYNQNTLTAYQIIINSLEKKRSDITGMMSKYEVKLEQLPGQENKLVRLVREKDVYEKMFTLLLDKREEMRLAELSKLQDIIIVDPAREPVSP